MKKKVLSVILVFSLLIAALPVHSAQAKQKKINNMSAKQIVKTLEKADYPIFGKKYYKSGEDVYSRYKSRATIASFGVEEDVEGTIRTYYSFSAAKKRYRYIKSYDGTVLRQRVYRIGKVVINVDPEMPSKHWKKIKSAFKTMYKGKKIKVYPQYISHKKMKINLGFYIYDHLELLPGPYGKVKWKVSNKKIVRLKKDNLFGGVEVIPKKVGKCTVTATYKKKKYKCKVTVFYDPDEI